VKEGWAMSSRAAAHGVFLLVGCVNCRADPLVGDGTMRGFFRELSSPGSLQRSKDLADHAKCRDLGFRPQTEAYGNCRLKLEEIRAIKESGETYKR
jgi:hypothetical protein